MISPLPYSSLASPWSSSIHIIRYEQPPPQIKYFKSAIYNNFNQPGRANASNSKLRSKYILHDKEQLYDDAIKLKEQLHKVQAENMQLKTKVLQNEKEIAKKDKDIVDIYNQFQSQAPPRLLKLKNDSYLVTSLKKQVKDLRTEKSAKEEELNNLKKKTKVTKLQEMEVEIKMYIDECTRLRHLLEEVIQQKSMVGQEDINMIEQKLNQQNNMLRISKQENMQLMQKNKSLEDELSKVRTTLTEKDKSTRKNDSKDTLVLKKTIETYKSEIEQLKQQLKEKANPNQQTKIDQLTSHNNNLTVKLE